MSMRIVKNHSAGFTLFELLLYMALAMIMLGVMGGIGVHMLEARSKIRAQEEVRYNALIIAETFQQAVHDAYDVVEPRAGETESVLVLSMEDPLKDPTVIEIVDGIVTLTEGSSDPIVMSAGSVLHTGSFTHVAGGEMPTVRFTLDVEARNPEDLHAFSASTTLHTAARIRYTP